MVCCYHRNNTCPLSRCLLALVLVFCFVFFQRPLPSRLPCLQLPICIWLQNIYEGTVGLGSTDHNILALVEPAPAGQSQRRITSVGNLNAAPVQMQV